MNSLFNFKKWLTGWDLAIESLDDQEEQVKIMTIINEANLLIENHCNEWEERCLENDLKNGTNTYSKLIESDKHKEFKRVSRNLLAVKFQVKNIFEIKHRRTKQNFDLRAELAELKRN